MRIRVVLTALLVMVVGQATNGFATPVTWELTGTIDVFHYVGINPPPDPVGQPFRYDITFDPDVPLCQPRPEMIAFRGAVSLQIGSDTATGFGDIAFNNFDAISAGPCGAAGYSPGVGYTVGAINIWGLFGFLGTDLAVSYTPGGVPALASSLGDLVSYVGSEFSIHGNGNWRVVPEPVPEPTTIGLLLLGMAGVVAKTRLRQPR